MSLGLGVFLIALGAILSFAVRDGLTGVDLVMIGYILMASGLAVVILSFVVDAQRRRRRSDVVVEQRMSPGDRTERFGR